MHWYDNAIMYHIYPLGFCGAPKVNDGGEVVNRLEKVREWIPHLKKLQIDAVYFGPVFESAEHGYDTTDYKLIDRRLGTNELFKEICDELHENGIRVILDGVFNHVGRNFWAFKDVQEKGQASPYCSWFAGLNFGGSSPCGDPFWYEGWNGFYNLVKLNLHNQDVCNHLIDAVGYWMDEFKIDGIRFDAADCVDFGFFKQIRNYCKGRNPEFWLMGEIIHGDYNRWANPEMLDSVTNYECHKGIYSSHNDKNYWEINYSINRQFGNGGIYKGLQLYSFVDNHDVDRLASKLSDARYRKLCYTLMYCMPGIPSIYYGSEYGIEGRHENNSDDGLRPCLDLAELESTGDRDLLNHIIKLGRVYKAYPALRTGGFETVMVQNRQLLFRREYDGKNVYVALNLDDQPFWLNFRPTCGSLVDVLSCTPVNVDNGNASIEMPPFSSMILVEDDIVNGAAEPETTPIEEPVQEEVVIGGRYRHYKGGEYEVLTIAQHTETNEDLVVYKNVENGHIWARPKTIFLGDNGGTKRFVKL